VEIVKNTVLDKALAVWAIIAAVAFILPTALIALDMPSAAVKLQAAGMYVYVIVLAICLIIAAMSLLHRASR